MERRPLIAANWKMNARPLGFDAPKSPYRTHAGVDVVVFPMFLDIADCIAGELVTGAQCGHPKSSGAFTGDVSMVQIAALGCTYVLCGHSDRRKNHGESDAFIAEQAIAALEAKLHPIVCIGETDEERAHKKEKHVIEQQMKALSVVEGQGITIAYEPVWAIGTGKNALPTQAQEMHAFIRSLLPKDVQATTRIIYGGSMNAMNAKDLLKENDIDGGLIGGASLKPDEFREIVECAIELA